MTVFILFLFIRIEGRTIFIAVNGSDQEGTGSIDNPYQTIQYTLSNQANSGDTILLREGIYEETVRIREPNLTISSYQNEQAVILSDTHDEEKSMTIRFDVDSDNCILKNIEIIGGYYYGIKFETRWDWGDSNDRSGTSNILIEGCKIHDTGRDCIKITPNCDHIMISNCEIYRSGIRSDGNAEGIDNVNGDSLIVRDCYIHDIATTGIYCKGGATGCVIERTKVENCGALGICLGFDTSPEYFDLDVNFDRYENIDGIVRNCLVINTVYGGIAMYSAKNPKIFNNTVVNTAFSAHSPIYFGLSFQDWETGGEGNYRPSTVNPSIMNNLIYQNTEYSSTMIEIRYADELGGMSSLEGDIQIDYNSYFHENRNCYFEDNRPGKEFYGNFSEWKNHLAIDSFSLEENPLLKSSYELNQESPCIDAGAYIDDVTDDFTGYLRSGLLDIGAFESRISLNNPPLPQITQVSLNPLPLDSVLEAVVIVTDSDNDSVMAVLSWGDSTVAENTSWGENGTVFKFEHEYQTAGEFLIKVKGIDEHGMESLNFDSISIHVTDITGLKENVNKKKITMSCFPNPFHDEIKIQCCFPDAVEISAAIYNPIGQKIKEFEKFPGSKKKYVFQWNGEDKNQELVSTGLYLFVIECNGKRDVQKIYYVK